MRAALLLTIHMLSVLAGSLSLGGPAVLVSAVEACCCVDETTCSCCGDASPEQGTGTDQVPISEFAPCACDDSTPPPPPTKPILRLELRQLSEFAAVAFAVPCDAVALRAARTDSRRAEPADTISFVECFVLLV